MAEAQDAEDRSEAPSPRRLQKAREEGDVARSPEVAGAAVMLAGSGVLVFFGPDIAARMSSLFATGFIFDQQTLTAGKPLPALALAFVLHGLLLVLPVLAATLIAAAIGPASSGGFVFAPALAGPRLARLDPMSGLRRMFGADAWMSLLRTLIKLAIVGAMAFWAIRQEATVLLLGEFGDARSATAAALGIAARTCLFISLALAVIAFADLFYQRHAFLRRMRMTRQEVRDEMKDAEGRPEIRARIRRRQKEVAQARMMERIRDADVVITNPEHFAVALAYDPSREGAPVVVAKGVDEVAFRIITRAREIGVQTFAAPPLARAIYFTTRLEQAIPEELYYAVAQVIAYVFSLASYGRERPPLAPPVVDLPSSMRFDVDGRHETSGPRP